jgi:hypothetical protein
MPLVNDSIPNFVNGVSQQPDALRLVSQGAAQSNCYSSVVEGLRFRAPTEHVAKIYTGTIGSLYQHLINRDTTERYVVSMIDDDLFVHDIAGVAKTVNFPDGKGYLNCANPKMSFRAMTIADYTFIVNAEITTAMETTLTANRGFEGLVFVIAGQYGSTYKVLIDGTVRATYTTSTTDVTTLRTAAIADDLKTQLNTWGAGTFTFTRSESTIHCKRDNGADFDLQAEDSQGGASMQVFKDKTQRFTELPTVAPDGFRIQITGSPDSEYDNYYIKFVVNNAGATFDAGTWEETVKQGIKYTPNWSTMPHVLIREANGTFTFQQAEWEDRLIGDETSAPDPSFIGAKINDLFFFKNRLFFLSGENKIGSEVGQYFNFWPTTVLSVLDSDRIDSATVHTKVSILKRAAVWAESAMVFSDQTQFIMKGGATLTQKSISTDPATEFECSLDANPIVIGRYVYFVVNKGNFNGLREFFIDQTTENKDANDVTGHIPAYIPKGIYKLAASSVEDVLVALTSADPNVAYVYKFFWIGTDKLQSAWFKIDLGEPILNIDFIETVAYITVQRDSGVYIEKMDFAPALVDADTAFGDWPGYVTFLDRRITNVQCTSVTYDSVNERTTFTLPYTLGAGVFRVVTRATDPQVGLGPGKALTIYSQGASTLVVNGDHSTQPVWIGTKITARYRLSTIHMREQRKGGSTIVTTGRLQLRKIKFVYDTSGYFRVEVTPKFRQLRTYLFTGKIIGDGNTVLGSVSLNSGAFDAGIKSKNDRVIIEIVSDGFLPFRITSAEWEGYYYARSQRV